MCHLSQKRKISVDTSHKLFSPIMNSFSSMLSKLFGCLVCQKYQSVKMKMPSAFLQYTRYKHACIHENAQ